MTNVPGRKEAVEHLSRHGIRGADLYLIDVIPLIEMVWADGHAQSGELGILEEFVRTHVEHVNKVAGYAILSLDQGQAFVRRFMSERPAPELLRTLRSLITPTRLSNSDQETNNRLRESLLAACLEIAASSVAPTADSLRQRINAQEKACFFEILDGLS